MAQGKHLQENSDPGKLWTGEGMATGSRMMTRCTGIAWHKGHGLKRQFKNYAGKGTQKGGRDKKRWKCMQCKNCIRNRDFKEQVRLGSERIGMSSRL
jgi:hypothetical protein